MNDEKIITVRDLINLYSGDLIYITDKTNYKLYHGFGCTCDSRLELRIVSKFRFALINGYFVLHITILN